MKLIVAIVNSADSSKVLTELSKNGFGATQLATSGGFLRAGNKTLLIGVEDDKVSEVIEIIKKKSQTRKQYVAPSDITVSAVHPIEVTIGGATVFVLDVDQFEKI